MDRNCTKCKYLWVPDESDVKKDGTYCRMCKKCREKRSVYVKKNADLFNKHHKEWEDPEYKSPYLWKNIVKK